MARRGSLGNWMPIVSDIKIKCSIVIIGTKKVKLISLQYSHIIEKYSVGHLKIFP